jgi:hypothetical protein
MLLHPHLYDPRLAFFVGTDADAWQRMPYPIRWRRTSPESSLAAKLREENQRLRAEGGCERETPGCGRVTSDWEAKLEQMSTELAVCSGSCQLRTAGSKATGTHNCSHARPQTPLATCPDRLILVRAASCIRGFIYLSSSGGCTMARYRAWRWQTRSSRL